MGKLKYYTLGIGCLFVILSSCSLNRSSGEEVCGDFAIEDESNYSSTTSSNYTIKDVVVVANCLTITVAASGCNGDMWESTLYLSEQTLQTVPIQRFSKLSLVTNEACLAVFDKSFSFDISNIRPENESFILTLEAWDHQIVIN